MGIEDALMTYSHGVHWLQMGIGIHIDVQHGTHWLRGNSDDASMTYSHGAHRHQVGARGIYILIKGSMASIGSIRHG